MFRLGFCTALLALGLGGCVTMPPDEIEQKTGQSGNTPLDNQATHAMLVRQMQDKGMWYASLAHIDALEKRWGVSDDSRLLRAQALRHTDQLDEAATLYRQLTTGSQRAAGWHGLGLVAGAQGRYADAVRDFERARQVNPTDGLLLSDLGFAYIMDDRSDDARLPIMQAMQLLPEHPKVSSNMALFLLVQNKPEEAARLMNERRLPPATRQAIERLARSMGHGTAVLLPESPPAQAPQAQASAARAPSWQPPETTATASPALPPGPEREALVLRASLQLSRVLDQPLPAAAPANTGRAGAPSTP